VTKAVASWLKRSRLKNCSLSVREQLYIHDSSVRLHDFPWPPEVPFHSEEGVSTDFLATEVFSLGKGALHNGCGG
jgi:hypothetical protein